MHVGIWQAFVLAIGFMWFEADGLKMALLHNLIRTWKNRFNGWGMIHTWELNCFKTTFFFLFLHHTSANFVTIHAHASLIHAQAESCNSEAIEVHLPCTVCLPPCRILIFCIEIENRYNSQRGRRWNLSCRGWHWQSTVFLWCACRSLCSDSWEWTTYSWFDCPALEPVICVSYFRPLVP